MLLTPFPLSQIVTPSRTPLPLERDRRTLWTAPMSSILFLERQVPINFWGSSCSFDCYRPRLHYTVSLYYIYRLPMTSQVSGNVLVPDIWRTLDFVSTLVRTNVIFKSFRAHSAIFTDRTYNYLHIMGPFQSPWVPSQLGAMEILADIDATVKLFAHFQD